MLLMSDKHGVPPALVCPSLLSPMCVSASLHALPLLILPRIIKDKCVALTNSPVRPAVPSRQHASLPDTALAPEFSWQWSCRCAKQNGIRLGSPLTCGLSKAHRIHTCLCLEIQQLRLSTQQTELQRETTPWSAPASHGHPLAHRRRGCISSAESLSFLAIAPLSSQCLKEAQRP